MREGAVANKAGHGWHDSETGKPVANPNAQDTTATPKASTADPSTAPTTPTSEAQKNAFHKAKALAGAIASLPAKLIPQRWKDGIARVKTAVLEGMKSRYGERSARPGAMSLHSFSVAVFALLAEA